jgi:thiol-disulfide isomerase/thioredoxin
MKKGTFGALSAALVLIGASPPQVQIPSLEEVLARDFEVVTLDGANVPLRDLLGSGRPLVVEYWATWCPPCRRTLPHLVALERRHGDGLAIVGLTVEDPRKDVQKVRDYVEARGVNFPVAFAPSELFQFMNSRPDVAVPKLFVFDSEGRTVTYIPRYSPLTGRKLESAVKQALSRDAQPRTLDAGR